MPYYVHNATGEDVAYRDDGGKVRLAPDARRVLRGDQHHEAARMSGADVVWVQSHRDIILAAIAEEEAAS